MAKKTARILEGMQAHHVAEKRKSGIEYMDVNPPLMTWRSTETNCFKMEAKLGPIILRPIRKEDCSEISRVILMSHTYSLGCMSYFCVMCVSKRCCISL